MKFLEFKQAMTEAHLQTGSDDDFDYLLACYKHDDTDNAMWHWFDNDSFVYNFSAMLANVLYAQGCADEFLDALALHIDELNTAECTPHLKLITEECGKDLDL